MFIQMHRCLYGVGMLGAAPKHKDELNIGPLEAPPNHLLLRHCLKKVLQGQPLKPASAGRCHST